MTRAVLDTNVLASGAVASPGTTLARIIDAMGQCSFELVVSEVILIELRRTLANPYYAGRSHSYSADQPAARPLPSWHPFQPCRACPEPHDNPRTGRLQPFLSNRAGDPGRAAGRRGHRAGDPGRAAGRQGHRAGDPGRAAGRQGHRSGRQTIAGDRGCHVSPIKSPTQPSAGDRRSQCASLRTTLTPGREFSPQVEVVTAEPVLVRSQHKILLMQMEKSRRALCPP